MWLCPALGIADHRNAGRDKRAAPGEDMSLDGRAALYGRRLSLECTPLRPETLLLDRAVLPWG